MSDSRLVNVVAHRGFSGKFPANTEIAFREAIALGVETVEFDVCLTRDGSPVVIHGPRVDKTTNGTGEVHELSLAEIKELDCGSWFGNEFRGQRVLTLPQALDVIGNGVRLNVNLKPLDHNRMDLVELAVAELRGRDYLGRAFIAADQESIELASRTEPRVEVCNLSVDPPDTYISRSADIGCRILQPRNARVDRDFVREAHANGMEVNPFMANDEEEMRRLIACGVDGILTDWPDLLIAVRENGVPRDGGA